MRRLAAACAIALTVACTSAPPLSASPTAPDIKRGKLDAVYTALSVGDVHRATSKQILDGAIAALNAEASATGGKADFPPLELQNVVDTVPADFAAFAAAAAAFSARNPRIAPDRLADVAIEGMIRASPDCHTYYVDAAGRAHSSRPAPLVGSAAQVPRGGTTLAPPDENGLQAKMLEGGVVYITFAAFPMSATYKITDELRKLLDVAVAAGARAWVFDFRGNTGGSAGGPEVMASWFLDGERTLRIAGRAGADTIATANRDLRLPAAYQLPIAVILNGTSASAPEVFALSLKENKRGTIVGARSYGCVGSMSATALTDGSRVAVTENEYVGAVTGGRFNNVGIDPDVVAADGDAVAKAIAAVTAHR